MCAQVTALSMLPTDFGGPRTTPPKYPSKGGRFGRQPPLHLLSAPYPVSQKLRNTHGKDFPGPFDVSLPVLTYLSSYRKSTKKKQYPGWGPGKKQSFVFFPGRYGADEEIPRVRIPARVFPVENEAGQETAKKRLF